MPAIGSRSHSSLTNASTLEKCFRKARVICKTSDKDDTSELSQPDQPLSELLETTAQTLGQPMMLAEYTDMDDAAPSNEELPDGREKTLVEEYRSE